MNSWYLNKPIEDWYCPVEISQLKSISRCLISPCKSLFDCNVFNLIYFYWLRSFRIWRWARLITHGFCIVFFFFFFFYLNSTLFNRVYHIVKTFYFVCSKKRPGHPSNPPYLIFRPNWKFLEPDPPPLGSGRPHPPLIWRSGSITAHMLSMNAVRPGADLGLILTDFLNEGPREKASRGAPGNFFWFLKSLKFPFSGFCLMPGNWKKKTFVQTIFQKVLLLLFYY